MRTRLLRLIERLAPLTEIGRKVSKDREAKVRAALAALQAIVAEIDGDGADDTQAAEAARQAEAVLEAELSHRDVERRLRDTLAKRHPGQYCWPQDVYADWAVYELTPVGQDAPTKLYRVDYTIDDAGVITLGDSEAVVRRTIYDPVSEAADGYEPSEAVIEALLRVYADDSDAELAEATKGGNVQTLIRTFGRKWAKGAHPQAVCVAALKGEPGIDNPDTLCAWLKDRATGTTKWRGKDKKEPLIEADLTGDLVPLNEKAVRKDGTAHVKIIQPGWGSSGYYAAEMLKRDGPMVFTKGLHMYADHPTATEERERPERSIRTFAGVLESDARWQENGADGPGLYADVKPIGVIKDVIEDLAPHIGVSIRALGKATQGEAEGRKGPIVESLVQAKSVDWVTQAGAGGKVLQLAESARAHRAGAGTAAEEDEVSEVSAEQLKAMQESLDTERTAREAADARVARLAESLILRDAGDAISEALAAVGDLPTVTKGRLKRELLAAVPVKEGALDTKALTTAIDEVIKGARAEVAAIAGGGRIAGMGGAPAETTPALSDALKARGVDAWQALGLSEAAAKAAVGV